VSTGLRFCMVTTFYPPYSYGGDGITVQRLATALVRAGHDVTVVHDAGAYAALPIFVFWTLIVVLIWLFLLGVSRIANGHYTIAEIISTFVMAASCVFGAVRAVQIGRPSPIGWRIAMFIGFAALQLLAMWISFTPSIANR